jgi:hypothetical protein
VSPVLVELILVAERQQHILGDVKGQLEVHKVVDELRQVVEYYILSQRFLNLECLLLSGCLLLLLTLEESLQFAKLPQEANAGCHESAVGLTWLGRRGGGLLLVQLLDCLVEFLV